jgi:pyridoxamine 5'-phosphate oxidase
MTTRVDAAFYNDLNLTLAEIQRVLSDGVTNRHAAAHNPVVASVDENGVPSQRVMILRECDWLNSALRFHTDMRSNKVDQFLKASSASVLIYDQTAKLQIRLTGNTRLGTDAEAQQAWDASTEFARRCYMVQSAPGAPASHPQSGLPEWIEGKKPNEAQLHDARANFAVLFVEFDSADWLYLANSGHRRAQFRRDNDHVWTGCWLIP